MRTVTCSLPAAANCGQCLKTRSSRPTCPRSTSISRHSATIGLPTEKTLTSVSRCQGLVQARSTDPAHRSTTGAPSSATTTAAPTSPCSTKLAANASRSAAKRGSQLPWISGTGSDTSRHPRRFGRVDSAARLLCRRPRRLGGKRASHVAYFRRCRRRHGLLRAVVVKVHRDGLIEPALGGADVHFGGEAPYALV